MLLRPLYASNEVDSTTFKSIITHSEALELQAENTTVSL